MRFSAATRALVQRSLAHDHGSVFRRTAVVPVGGLRSAGAVPGTEHWLVISVSGRGLVDGRTGERLARDPSPRFEQRSREGRCQIQAIGPHAGTWVDVGGLEAGALPLRTEDGWQLAFDVRAGLWLAPPGSTPDGPTIEVLRMPIHDEPRILGFSGTGRSFAAGDGAMLAIYAR